MRTPSQHCTFSPNFQRFLASCLLFSFSVIPSAEATVFISEVLWAGSDLSAFDEWLEITATGSGADLSGWKLTSVNTKGIEIEAIRFGTGTKIEAGKSLVIAHFGASASRLLTQPAFVTNVLSLPNTKLLVRLRNASGAIVDQADDGIGDPMAGHSAASGSFRASMERIDGRLLGTLSSSWRTATEARGFDAGALVFGTPGFFTEPISPEQQMYSSESGGSVAPCLVAHVTSGSSLPSPCSTPELGEQCDTTMIQTPTESGSLLPCALPSITSSSSSSSSVTPEEMPSIFFDLGVGGYCTVTATTGVVISEILPTAGKFNDPEEWVEIGNNADTSIDLCGWSIDDDAKGSPAFSLDRMKIGPGSFMVFRQSRTGIRFGDTKDHVRLLAPHRSLLGLSLPLPSKRTAPLPQEVIEDLVYTEGPRHDSAYARDLFGDFHWSPVSTPGAINRFEPAPFSTGALLITAVLPNPFGKDDSTQEWLEIQNKTDDPYTLDGWFLGSGKSMNRLPVLRLEAKEVRRLSGEEAGLQIKNSSGSLQLFTYEKYPVSQLSWNKAEEGDVYRRAERQQRLRARLREITTQSGITLEYLDIPPSGKVEETGLMEYSVKARTETGGIFEEIVKESFMKSALYKNKIVELEMYTKESAEKTEVTLYLPGIVPKPPLFVATAGSVVDLSSEETHATYTAHLRISEVMTHPKKGEDEWIELLNGGPDPIALHNWIIQDGSKKPTTRSYFTEEVIPAGGYQVFPAKFLHLKLNDSGETMHLLDPSGTEQHTVSVPKLKEGESYARITRSGGEKWCLSLSTPGEENKCKIVMVKKSKEPLLKAKKKIKKVVQKKTKAAPILSTGSKIAASLLADLHGEQQWTITDIVPADRESTAAMVAIGSIISGLGILWLLSAARQRLTGE